MESSNTTPLAFPRFLDLPAELQLQIWEDAMPNAPSAHNINMHMKQFAYGGNDSPVVWHWNAISWLEPKGPQPHGGYKTLRETCVTSKQVVDRYQKGKGMTLPIDIGPKREEFISRLANFPAEDFLVPPIESAQVHIDDLLIMKEYSHGGCWPFPPEVQFERTFFPGRGARHLAVPYCNVAEFIMWPLHGHIAYAAEVPTTTLAFFFIFPPETFSGPGGEDPEASEEEEWSQGSESATESLELKVFRDPRRLAPRQSTPEQFWMRTRRYYTVSAGHVEEGAPSAMRKLIRALHAFEEEMCIGQSAIANGWEDELSKFSNPGNLPQISWGFMTWEDLE
ncbi:hypothetical protein F5X68DRAFT_237445 [Plectosphaerella plurivora]|uniref:2EXR domain-containing protein n=1 Tax=Plectosphaerella plurivora TaxID=936078 RepID=A0A9P9A3K8_9PEZI|nr:hypothetical protein F5X68DRAFT_237445 [Plectosphaerella plurivora]